jgi:hypothetical protein
MMIRNILIITVIAALVPTAMSNVSASAGSEIALFSGVSDSDGLSISGNGDTAKMELKATNENGKSNKVSDFQMNADNVLNINVGDKVTVNDNVDITKAITTDGNNNQKAIGITSNGVIDFTGYAQGISTLDVVVDDDRAYEAIIVIGQQPPEVIHKQVTKVNNNQETRVQFVFPDPPKPPKCDEGEELINGKCEPKPPKCKEGEELIDGKCQPIPIYCPAHAGGCETPCGPSGDLDVCYSWDDEEPEPEPSECSEGEELVDAQCVSLDTNPVEPNDLVPISDEDDNGDDQAIIDEGDTDESENEEQNEDESGEGEDEAEDEGSEEESEGESEEESQSGN